VSIRDSRTGQPIAGAERLNRRKQSSDTATICHQTYRGPRLIGVDLKKPSPKETSEKSPSATIVNLAEVPGVDCPCGIARRAFADRDDFPGTVHLTSIHVDARTHYHREHTEVYVILKCDEDAAIELDGELFPVSPLTSILIPPNVRHRAVGKMEVVILSLPDFDPADEHFD